MTFAEKLTMLCNERGMSLSGLASKLGMSTTTATGWRRGAVPSKATLKKIADYFGVTVEFLESEEQMPSMFEGHTHSEEYTPLSSHEKMMIDLWRSLDEQGKTEIIKAFMKQYNIETCRMWGIPNPYGE